VTELAAGWQVFGLDSAVVVERSPRLSAHHTRPNTPGSLSSAEEMNREEHNNHHSESESNGKEMEDPSQRGLEATMPAPADAVPVAKAKALLASSAADNASAIISARGNNINSLEVNIASPPSIMDLMGKCGVMSLQSSTGSVLVLARVQQASWFG